MILDLNGFTCVDQLLQPDFFLVSQKTILALFQQALDFHVHLIQRLDVCRQPLRHTGVAVLIGSFFQRLQFGARAVRQVLKRIRPLGNNFVGFLFTVRPDGQQTIQPFLRGLLVLDEIFLGHAEEGKTLAVPIEGLRRCAFPVIGGFLHAFQCLTCLLCTGHIICNGHRGINGRCGNGQPYGRRAAQN